MTIIKVIEKVPRVIKVGIQGPAGQGSATFIGLTDTPNSYIGKAGLFVKVNVEETGLEFASGIGDMLKTTYDPDNNGVVNSAESVDGGTW